MIYQWHLKAVMSESNRQTEQFRINFQKFSIKKIPIEEASLKIWIGNKTHEKLVKININTISE